MSDWSLPQDELPGRAPVPESVLYRRRERVFVLFAVVFVVAAALLPLLGFGRLFGVSWTARAVGLEPSIPLLVPLGALALPFGLLALDAVGALFGKRRTRWLIVAMLVVWAGVLGLAWATDHLTAYDGTTTAAFWPALALVACGLVTCVVQSELFALLGGWLRHVVAPLLGIAAGGGVLALLAQQVPGVAPSEPLLGVLLGGGGYVWLAVLAGTVPAALLVRALAIYLRVARRREPIDAADSEPAFVVKKPRALIVETPVPGTVRKRPFTTEEIAFFDAGDELGASKH